MRAVLLKSLVLYRTGVPGGFCLFPYAALPDFGVIPFSRSRSKQVDSSESQITIAMRMC